MTLSLTLFISFITTFITLLTLNKFAPAIGLLDRPSSRKVHSTHTPLTGGIAIAIGVSFTLLLATPHLTNSFIWIFGGAIFMVLTGAYDDLRTLPVTHRFLIQGCVASLVIIGGDLKISSLGLYPVIGSLELELLSYPITLFALLTGINAVNLIDGLDGLAGSICLVTFLVISLLTSFSGYVEITAFCAILSMALLSFLSKNMRFPWQKTAKAFLGDAGSTALGFTLACLVIHLSNSAIGIILPTTALWLLAIPIIDTLSVIIRRKQNNQPPFSASKDHLHHILLECIPSVSIVVALIVLYVIITMAIGIALNIYGSDGLSLSLFFLVACVHHYSAHIMRQYSKRQASQAHIQISNQSVKSTQKESDQEAA